MTARQSIAALTATLGHRLPMDACWDRDRDDAREQVFNLRALILVFAALAVAPFFLAFHGAPSLAQTLIFSLCLAPLGAVMLVSKTGQLVTGHLIGVICLVAASVMLAVIGHVSLGCALAWLIVAMTESLLSFNRRLVIATAILTGLVFCGLAAADLAGALTASQPIAHVDLLVGLALALGIVNTMGVMGLGARWHKAEQAKHDRTRVIADTIGDLVISFDSAGGVDFVDRACERLLAIPTQDLMGRGLFEQIHVGDRPLFLKALADATHGDGTVAVTFRLRTILPDSKQDGGFEATFLWIEMRARRFERPNAKPGVMSLLRDVTAQTRDATDLEVARLAAETASRSKDQFLANMSHELRTPLNAIIGFSEMLSSTDLRPSDPAKQTEYAGIIHQSGQHLLAVVNSILDMSKIQSGTFSIIPETFEVGPLIESCCDIVTLKAREGRIEIIRTDSSALDPVVGDRRACKQILINLLSNAVKFTPENGRVSIGARPEGNSLLICVADTGIGIGATDLVRLGDPFFQAKSAFNRPYEGTGLGLSVVRGLVGLHGGTISVESEPGHGTSVTIRLPLDCRFMAPGNPSAKIETIARRRPHDRFVSPSLDTMVKKIA